MYFTKTVPDLYSQCSMLATKYNIYIYIYIFIPTQKSCTKTILPAYYIVADFTQTILKLNADAILCVHNVEVYCQIMYTIKLKLSI